MSGRLLILRCLPWIALLYIIGVSSCGGGTGPVASPDESATQAAIGEITAAPVPQGVDDAVYELLRSELIQALHSASLAPSGGFEICEDGFIEIL